MSGGGGGGGGSGGAGNGGDGILQVVWVQLCTKGSAHMGYLSTANTN